MGKKYKFITKGNLNGYEGDEHEPHTLYFILGGLTWKDRDIKIHGKEFIKHMFEKFKAEEHGGLQGLRRGIYKVTIEIDHE